MPVCASPKALCARTRCLVELGAEISQENELGVTKQLKRLLQSCVGAAAAFLRGVSLEFVMDFS